MIDVKIDMHRVIETYDMLLFLGEQLPGASAAAVLDTLNEGREILVEELGRKINAPSDVISSRVGRTKAHRPTRLVVEGRIFVRKTPIKLRVFSPVQGEKGVTYYPYRSGSGKFIRHAFGPDIRRLGNGVFTRTGRRRTPINKQPGMRLDTDPVATEVVSQVTAQIPYILKKNMDKHVQHLFHQLTRGQPAYDIVYVERKAKGKGGFGSADSST